MASEKIHLVSLHLGRGKKTNFKPRAAVGVGRLIFGQHHEEKGKSRECGI